MKIASTSTKRKYENKHVVVTGAGAGIGKCLVERLLDWHGKVVGIDSNPDALNGLKEYAEKYGRQLLTFQCDVTNIEKVNAVIDEATEAFGSVDYWFNNAGINGTGEFLKMTTADFNRVIAVNLMSVVDISRLVLEKMEQSGHGALINMGSIAGHVAAPLMTAYVAAKHGVTGFTRALQAELELRDSPVRCVLVSPGFVETQIVARGQKLGFPDWLSWMLSPPTHVASAILTAVARGDLEIIPNWNGKMMLSMFKAMPQTTVRSSKVLLAKNWKDAVLKRYEI